MRDPLTPFLTIEKENVDPEMEKEGYRIFNCTGNSGAFGILICNTRIGTSCFTLSVGGKDLTSIEKTNLRDFCEHKMKAPLESTIHKKRRKKWKKS